MQNQRLQYRIRLGKQTRRQSWFRGRISRPVVSGSFSTKMVDFPYPETSLSVIEYSWPRPRGRNSAREWRFHDENRSSSFTPPENISNPNEPGSLGAWRHSVDGHSSFMFSAPGELLLPGSSVVSVHIHFISLLENPYFEDTPSHKELMRNCRQISLTLAKRFIVQTKATVTSPLASRASTCSHGP